MLLLDDIPAARAHLAQAARHLQRCPDATVIRDWIERAWEEIDARAQSPALAAERRRAPPAALPPTHLSFREIAADLFVSPNTVKTQARSIYRKLGVSSRPRPSPAPAAPAAGEEQRPPRRRESGASAATGSPARRRSVQLAPPAEQQRVHRRGADDRLVRGAARCGGCRMKGRVCGPPRPPWKEISSSKAQPSSSVGS